MNQNKGPAPGSILEGATKPRFMVRQRYESITTVKPLNFAAECILNEYTKLSGFKYSFMLNHHVYHII